MLLKKNKKRENKKPPEFYFTKEEMVKDLLAITPIKPEDVVLDAGSGNLVWFGRYYYLIWGKENKNFISWELKSY